MLNVYSLLLLQTRIKCWTYLFIYYRLGRMYLIYFFPFTYSMYVFLLSQLQYKTYYYILFKEYLLHYYRIFFFKQQQ